jgi:hypothetical protein
MQVPSITLASLFVLFTVSHAMGPGPSELTIGSETPSDLSWLQDELIDKTRQLHNVTIWLKTSEESRGFLQAQAEKNELLIRTVWSENIRLKEENAGLKHELESLQKV